MLSFSASRSMLIVSRLVSNDVKKLKLNRYSSLIHLSQSQINRKLPISSSQSNLIKLSSSLFSTTTVNNNKIPSEGEEVSKSSEKKQQNQVSKIAFEDYDDYDANEPTGAIGYLTILFRLSVFGIGIACIGLTVNELLPKRMSTNSLFSAAFEKVQMNDEVRYVIGDSGIKAYGKDIGSQGRRNQIDNRKYKSEQDGSNRLRVRFNVEGNRGHVLVWAELSDKYSDDFVYLICQDFRTGKVVTVIDNRDSIEAMGGSNSDSMIDNISKWFNTTFTTSPPTSNTNTTTPPPSSPTK